MATPATTPAVSGGPSAASAVSSAATGATSAASSATAAATSATPTPTCPSITAQQAARQAISSMNPPKDVTGASIDRPWVTDTTTGFDACADLSWISFAPRGATGDSPETVALFHKGRFVRTIGSDIPTPTVSRLADGKLSVTWTYLLPTDGRQKSGHAASTFTWDGTTAVRTGSLPSFTMPGAPSVPTDYTEVTSVMQGYGMVISPSGTFGCDLQDSDAECMVSKGKSAPNPTDIVFHGSDKPFSGSPQSVPMYQSAGMNPQKLSVGQAVHHKNFVVQQNADGMTVWDLASGHVATFTRTSFKAW